MPTASAPRTAMDRRSFLRVSALSGGGMLVALYGFDATAPALAQGQGTPPPPLSPNAFIRIEPTARTSWPRTRAGQGVIHAADDHRGRADVDWANVRIPQRI